MRARLKKRDWDSISMVRKNIDKKTDAELVRWLMGAKRLKCSRIKEHVIMMIERALRKRGRIS